MIDVRPFVSTFRTCHSVLYCERIGKVGWGVHERDLYMVNQKLRDDLTDQLCRAILSLDTMEECYQFFEDICTVGELRAMAQRLDVARMLYAGNTYDDIVARTGASTATISRVKRCLNYGADGYTLVLEKGIAAPLTDKEDH